MKSNLRQPDIIARYGGDEFIILMSNNNGIESAITAIERIRKLIADEQFTSETSSFHVTCSFGIVAFKRSEHREKTSKDEIIAKADAALYASKSQGKNRVYTLDIGEI